MSALAYSITEAAEIANVSADLVRKGIASTDARKFPPPLRAKKVGNAANARTLILADELAAWLAAFPDA